MKTFKKACAVSIIVALSSALLPVVAQSETLPLRDPIPFSAYDKDGNGSISENEFNTVRAERMSAKAAQGKQMRGAANAPTFASFDQDVNGKLTQEELLAGQKAQMAKRQNKRQSMGKGFGRGQMMGKNMPSFAEFDLNSDGKLLEQEFYEARAQRISNRAKQGYKMKHVGSAPSFEDIDTNNDGKINETEFSEHQVKHFATMKNNRKNK